LTLVPNVFWNTDNLDGLTAKKDAS